MVVSNVPDLPPKPSSREPLAARLSKNIAARRKALGLTQAELAERLGVDTETLSRFERGKHLPSLVTLERLAGLLLVTMAELLAEEPSKADDDALAVEAWMSSLLPEDKVFVKEMVKQWCDHLAARRP